MRSRHWFVLFAILSAPVSARAATHTVSVYVDRGNSPATGCTVALPAGAFAGVELEVRTTVVTDAVSARVDQIEVLGCNGTSLTSPVVIDTGDWAVPFGSGDNATARIETYLPRSIVTGSTVLRVAVATSGDAMTTASAGGPILILLPGDVPLSPALLFCLALSLLIVGTVMLRRAVHPFVALFFVAFVVVAAAPVVTWSAQNLLATDPKGDAPPNGDLVSFYAQVQNASVVMRIDADVRADAPSNLPPVVNAGADQTITLPDNGAALAGVATDDGVPSPAALTLRWTQVSGPSGSYIVSPAKAVTDVGFGMAGTYVLRLTANDGVLAGSDDVTVTVIAESNAPPVLPDIPDRTLAVGGTLSIEVAADDPNPRDTLTYSLAVAPAGAQLTPAGSPLFRFTPTLAQTGPQPVRVRVQDQAGTSDTEDFVINVVNGNEPPLLAAQASARVPIGVAFSRTLTATDPDLPGDTLTFSLLSGPAGMSVAGNQLQWTPSAADRGDRFVTVAVTDLAGARDQRRFVLTAYPAGSPVAHDDTYEIVLGQTLSVAAAGVLANDIDPDGGALTATRTTNPDKGTVTAFGANGSFSYQAPPSLTPPPPLDVRTKRLSYNPNSVLIASSTVIGDLNSDGRPEIFFQYPNNGFAAIQSDGTALFDHSGNLPIPGQTCWAASNSQPALGDINDDGDVEILLGVTCLSDQVGGPFAFANDRVAAISYGAPSGIVVDWLSPRVAVDVNRADTQNVHFTIARLAPSEKPSVLWGRTFNSGTGPCSAVIAGKTDSHCRIVTAHSGADGTMTRRYYFGAAAGSIANWGGNHGFLGATVPIVADLDGDNDLEIVADGTVWNLDGTVALALDGSSSTQPPTVLDSVVGDLNGDGAAEIVTAELYNGFGSAGPLSAYHANGTLMWRTQIPGSTVQSRMTLADLDRDGRPEILFSIYSSLYVIDADGRYKWVRTLDHGGVQYLNSGGGFSSRFAVYDLNGDGIVEVIVQDGKNDVLFLRGDTGETQTTWHYSDPAHPSEPSSSSQVQMAPTVADLDGDGHAEVALLHDINLNGTYAVVMLEGVNAWRAAPRWFSQRGYTGNDIEANGRIPSTPPRWWTSAATNVFGQQPPAPYALDPRLRTTTSFQYRARNAAVDSAPATVTIGILPANRPPVVTSTPPSTATLQDHRFIPPGALTYQITAVDPDNDLIAYQLTYRGCGSPGAVTVSSSGLFSYADGSPFDGVLCLFGVELNDGRGGVTSHLFTILFTNQTTTVPSLVGTNRIAAPATLSASNLVLGRVIEVSNAAAAGIVIGQSPVSGNSVSRGATVDLTVSKGPQPRVLPNVVGRPVGLAGGLLGAAGFSTGATTYVYHATIPRNEVISQSPAAGTVLVPAPVALSVSAGTGLELRLARSVTTTDVPITFTAVSFTLAGVESPASGLNFAVTPIATPFLGSLPVVSGNTLTFISATRGAFRLTATDPGTGRTATADFAVGPARISGTTSQAEQFAKLTETLAGVNGLVRQAKAAVDANDTATAKARLKDAVLLWRSFDSTLLRIAAPFSPDNGFPPEVSDLPSSVTPGPDDLVNRQLIAEAAEALRAWTAGLRGDTTSMAQLETLADAFIVKARLLRGLTPGEYGTVLAAPEYAEIATQCIPDLFDALTDELAPVAGLSTRSPLRSDSTLSDVIVSLAINYILERINEAAAYTRQILTQALYGAAIVGVTQHVKTFVQGKEIEEVVSGASLSFRFFESPYSLIEGKKLERKYPDLNTVFVVGPQLFSVVRDLIEKIKGASKLNVDPDDPSGEPRYKNLQEIFDGFAAVINAAKAVNQAFDNAQQPTKLADRPCVFTSDPTCVQLMYPDGFISVYEYAPPPGLSQLTGLPLPIVFMVKNNVNGQILFGTPIFFPSPPEP